MLNAVIFTLVLGIPLSGASIYLFVLLIRALRKYINSTEMRKENQAAKASLGEAIKTHRMRCQMTQEFVPDALGVSRQSVSKWENGTSDPSTSNLIALAKLFKISPEKLLNKEEKYCTDTNTKP